LGYQNIKLGPVTVAILVFGFTLLFAQFITYQKYLLELSNQRGQTAYQLGIISDKVDNNLTNALNTAKTLSFIIENYGMPKSFDSLANKLIANKPIIQSIQVLKNGIITHNYPENKSSPVVGYNVLTDTLRNVELIKNFTNKEFYFGGPLKLRQGGLGIVGRIPINNVNNSLNFAAVVIKLDSLLTLININNNQEKYLYAISKVNPNTGKEEFFINKKDLFNKKDAAKLYVPKGDWKIYIKPKVSYSALNLIPFAILGFLLAITTGLLAWFITKQPFQLRLKVLEQTKIITDTKNKFENLVENSLGASLIIDKKKQIIFASSSLKNILGYSASESVGLNYGDFINEDNLAFFNSKFNEVLLESDKTLSQLIYKVKHKDGTWHWIESSLTNLIHEKSIEGIVLNFKDITDRKNAEEENIKEKELLNSIINSLPGIFYLFNDEGKFLMWNNNFEKISGYTASEIKTMHPTEFFDEPEQPYLQSKIADTFEYGISKAETYFFTKDKRKIYFYFTGVKVHYKGMNCLLGTGIDSSEWKNALDNLRKSEEEMISIFNNAIDAVIVIDIKGIIRNWNPKAETIFGWRTDEAIGQKLSDFIIPPQHRESHEKGMAHYKNTGHAPLLNKTTEITALNKKGKEFEISLGISNANFGGKEYFIGFIADISQRKQEEQQKEFERQDKEALINSTHDLMWSVNNNFELLAANNSFLQAMQQYTNKKISVGDDLIALSANAPTEYLDFWQTSYNRALQGERFLKEITVPNENKDLIIETIFNPIIVNENIEGVACFSRDITKRKKIKNQLIDINKKLTTAQEIGKIGYWELDLNTNELFWSDEAYVVWEVNKDNFKMSFEAVLKTIHKDDIEAYSRAHKKAIESGTPLNHQHRIVLANDTIKWVHQRAQIVFDEKEQPIKFEGTVQDINKEKLVQLEIEEQNKFISTAIQNLPIGIAVNRISDGKSTLINNLFAHIYGWPPEEIAEVNDFFEKVYPNPVYRDKIKKQVLSDMSSGNPDRMNWDSVKITTKSGQERIINAKNIPLFEQDLMISSVLDVTEKALAEQKLLLSNERYQYVTKATFDVIWDWDLVKNEVYWGEGMKAVFGYNKLTPDVNEAIKKIHPEDVELMMASIDNVIKNPRLKNWSYEYRFLKSDGSYAYVKNRGIVIRNMDREAIRMVGSIRDVTMEKEYEKQILETNEQLRRLTDHLQTAREEERIYIAREIHDELGQRLTGIKLDASWIKNKIQNIYPEGLNRIQQLIEAVNETINKVRKLATDLRPGVLDDLGLEAAIEWHIQQFKNQSKLKIKLKTNNLKPDYNKAINTTIYRIFQEAMTNIARHANATAVKVNLVEEDNIVTLRVIDNGQGISEKSKNNGSSLGITGMRERAEIIGGTFTIKKHENKGTIVEVSIPV
jgi:two-component system CheB/CheR fusion protein